MKRLILSTLCVSLLAACGPGSTELPSKETSMSYYQEFDEIISEEYNAEEYQLIRRYMRRVNDYEPGTTAGEALAEQKTFEEEQRRRIKEAREKAFSHFSGQLNELKDEVAAIKSRFAGLESDEAIIQFVKDNFSVDVVFLRNEIGSGTTQQIYRIDITAPAPFSLVRTELHFKKDGEDDIARQDFSLKNMEKTGDEKYTTERTLMNIYSFGGAPDEEPVPVEFTPVLKSVAVNGKLMHEDFTVKSLADYIKRLDSRVSALESIREKFAAGKYTPKQLSDNWKRYGSSSWHSKDDKKRFSRFGY